MKKILISLLFLFVSASMQAQTYYYSGGVQIPLLLDSTQIVVRLYDEKTASTTQQKIANVSNSLKINDLQVGGGGGKILIISNLTQQNSVFLQNLKKSLVIDAEFVCFSYKVGSSSLHPTNNIILELQPNVAISSVLQMFGSEVSLEKSLKYDTYLLKVNQISRLFDIANQIYTSGWVKYAHPDFIAPIERSNLLYPQQYYLNNTGQNGGTSNIDINAPEAWALVANACSANARIRVAVIDDGVETHDDLNNLLPFGYSPLNLNGNGRPALSTDSHGQACSGIIGADNNVIGARGVATNVDILPLNIFIGGETFANIASAINWAWDTGRADVLSNSWAYNTTSVLSDAIVSAIQKARTLGRSGKGCIVVFASGNFNTLFSGVSFPANVAGVITVGAIDKNGTLFGYSSRGAEMDLVAPSGETGLMGDVTTLDRMGTNGYETGDYTNRFGGTSAACPQVAGVAALMLQTNPNLTEVEVREILQQTARRLGRGGFNNNTGYGLVDAQAAVTRVLSGNTRISPSSASHLCPGTTQSVSLIDMPIGATVTWQASNGAVSPSSGVGAVATVTPTSSGFTTITFTMVTCGITRTFTRRVTTGLHLDFPAGSNLGVINGNFSPIIGTTQLYTYPLPNSYDSFNCVATPIGFQPPYPYQWEVQTCNISNGQMVAGIQVGTGIANVGIEVYKCGVLAGNFTWQIMPVKDPNCDYGFKIVYPNPTRENLTIERTVLTPRCVQNFKTDSEVLPYEVKIYDSYGTLKGSQTTKIDTITLNVANLPSGLYVLHIIHNGEVEQKRVLLE